MNSSLKKFIFNIYHFSKIYLQKNKASLLTALLIILAVFIIGVPDILGLLLHGHLPNFFPPYIQAMRIYMFITAPVFFLPGIWGKVYFYIEIIILTFVAMASLILLNMFNLPISGDCYALLFNTHLQEATEFMITLIRYNNMIIIILSILFIVFWIWVIKRNQWQLSVLHISLGIICLMPLSITLLRYHSKNRPISLAIQRGSLGKFACQYFEFKNKYAKTVHNLTKKPILPAPTIEKHPGKTVGIIVIGESAWRKHHSIYGYARNTTPNLMKRKSSILPFNNVISADIQTPTSIRYALTDAVADAPDILNYSVIDLFKNAGYKTHWVSNQPAWGLGGYESSTTFLAMKCDSVYFLHKENPNQKLDEGLIAPVSKLIQTDQSQIIFVHLQGSHIAYSERYPKTFGSFTDCKDDHYHSIKIKRNKQKTNEYDNSIEYTDYILEQLILLLEGQNTSSFMLYFSDHSECADIDNFTTRRASTSREISCYEIPFLFWYSPQYAVRNRNMLLSGKKNLNAPMQCDNALWTICNIAEIFWDGFPYEKSLLSQDYIPPTKRIIDNKDF